MNNKLRKLQRSNFISDVDEPDGDSEDDHP